MEKGELFKITCFGCVYWGIFKESIKGYNVFYAVKDSFENRVGLSKYPNIPVPVFAFKKGTKIRRWKPKTFDKKICYFGLAVRDGVFCDRFSITEETANKLIEQFNKLRILCSKQSTESE
jgi:hypothetical protein